MGRFVVGEFDIDVARCRISSGDYKVILEPKVMDVLQFLYSRRGEVVSQQEIYTSVWPSTTFNPSSVQRCIALLRKALKEDSKNAKFIITHPKRGYSLENSTLASPNKIKTTIIGLILTLVISAVLVSVFKNNDEIKQSYTSLTPITSNEKNESGLMLSPSGELIAFIRGDKGSQHIWLKDLISEKEVQLTQHASTYLGLGWNKNESALAFVEYTDSKSVMSYITLDKLTLTAINQKELHQFSSELTSKGNLYWNDKNQIYFVQENITSGDDHVSYIDLTDRTTHQVFKARAQESLVALAISNDQTRLAFGVSIGQNLYRLDILNLDTLETSTLTTVENNIANLSWHPRVDSILISNRDKLQVVNMAGKVSDIQFNNYRYIGNAQFDKNSGDILMVLSNVDFDIWHSTRDCFEQPKILVNSSALDFNPVYSPDSKRFIFESHRAGHKKLYLYENGQQRVVFSNPNNEELFGALWTHDGTEIIAASKNKLFRIDVQTTDFIEIPHQYKPFYLRDHFYKKNALLVSYRIGEKVVPAKLDLDSMALTTYSCSGESLACYSMALDQQDTIYFTNDQELFKIDSDLKPVKLWRSTWQNTRILNISNNSILLDFSSDKEHKVINLSLANNNIEQIYQGPLLTTEITNVSPDLKQYLYLSKPKLNSELVRLK